MASPKGVGASRLPSFARRRPEQASYRKFVVFFSVAIRNSSKAVLGDECRPPAWTGRPAPDASSLLDRPRQGESHREDRSIRQWRAHPASLIFAAAPDGPQRRTGHVHRAGGRGGPPPVYALPRGSKIAASQPLLRLVDDGNLSSGTKAQNRREQEPRSFHVLTDPHHIDRVQILLRLCQHLLGPRLLC